LWDLEPTTGRKNKDEGLFGGVSVACDFTFLADGVLVVFQWLVDIRHRLSLYHGAG
jgi:hypothetical protein